MKLATPLALALALLLTAPSIAHAQPGDAGRAPNAAASKGAAADPARKPARRGAKAKEQETGGVSRQARSIARHTKSVYIYAQESCARAPDRCDKELLDDAEARFVESCGACNTAERCEAERDAVKAGTARASQDPCRRRRSIGTRERRQSAVRTERSRRPFALSVGTRSVPKSKGGAVRLAPLRRGASRGA